MINKIYRNVRNSSWVSVSFVFYNITQVRCINSGASRFLRINCLFALNICTYRKNRIAYEAR